MSPANCKVLIRSQHPQRGSAEHADTKEPLCLQPGPAGGKVPMAMAMLTFKGFGCSFLLFNFFKECGEQINKLIMSDIFICPTRCVHCLLCICSSPGGFRQICRHFALSSSFQWPKSSRKKSLVSWFPAWQLPRGRDLP